MADIIVADITPRIQYTAGGGGPTVFSYPFAIFSDTDLNVYLTPNGQTPNDVSDILVYNVNYTVTNSVPPTVGGTITLTSPASNGDIITIARNMPDNRLNNYIDGGLFQATQVNTDFDRTVLMAQQNKMYDTVLGVHYNVSANPQYPRDVLLPILGPNQVWQMNSGGTAIIAASNGGGGGGTVSSVSGTANQISVSPTTGSVVVSFPNTVIFPGTVTLNANPVTALQAATKQYVDAIAAGFEFKATVSAASTTTLTVTYNNGSSGVGATLTNAGAQATFSIDGQTPGVGSRILIKNQSSTLQNGIYTVTNAGSNSTNWVLTRATDFDEPSEILAGSLVPVLNGTLNADTFWVETATVTTVGTDAITFSQFSSAPISLPLAATQGGTGLSSFSANTVLFASAPNTWIASGTPTLTSIAFSPTTGGIIGTTNADNASSGKVGEVISHQILQGAAVGISTGVTTNLMSISLTAGDWDVQGNAFFINDVTTTYTEIVASISTTSATFPDESVVGRNTWPGGSPQTSPQNVVTPYQRINVSTTTTVYLVVFASFAVSTMTVCGYISARRAR